LNAQIILGMNWKMTDKDNRLKMRLQIHPVFFRISAIILALTSLIPEAFCDNKPFLISTEFQIGKIKHMVEQAPEGIYISVGSERSFRGISMAPHMTHAYLLDLAPEIIRFNKINIELLKAPTRKEYLHLRWESPYADWKKLKLNLTSDDFEWWKKNVRNLENMAYPLPEALNRYHSYPYAKRFVEMRGKLISFYQTWKSKETPELSEKQFIESSTFNQIKDVGKRLTIPVTITQKEWHWWTAYGRNKKLDCPKVWLENPEQAVDLGQVVDYKTGNYLFEDTLYQRLHHFATNGLITTMKIDLSDDAQLEKFLALLKKQKAPLSVLDLDNLYFEEYIGDIKYKEIVEKFLPFGKDESLLIVMSNYKDYACGQFQAYIGFTFENIHHWPAYFFLQSFFDTLPKPLTELINGRVYEKDETPPLHYLLGE
jgi:hypothetical protein